MNMQVGSMLLITVRPRNFDTLLAKRFNAEPDCFQSLGLELLKSIGKSHVTDDREEPTSQRQPRSKYRVQHNQHLIILLSAHAAAY
jgi:hypothetical protein